jgi:hypothetical protein
MGTTENVQVVWPSIGYGWIPLPIGGDAGENLDVGFFYELGRCIGVLKATSEIAPGSKAHIGAIERVDSALDDAAKSPALPLVRDAATELLDTLRDQFGWRLPWEEPTVPSAEEIERLRNQISTFGIVFPLELKKLHTYRLTPAGLMDPAALIERPEAAFEEHWGHLSDVAQSDWKSACRCLAFDLPTASRFHVLRCVEAVALGYIDKLNLPRPSNRSLGAYLDLLKQNGASPEKIEAAQKIRVLYRNPLMHPEDTLTLRDAEGLLNLCVSMILLLLDDMQSKGLFKSPAKSPAKKTPEGN